MSKETCKECKRETVSVLPVNDYFLCYNCYAERKNAKAGAKKKRSNEEAEIQSEFFSQAKLFFPQIPDKLLFAVPNGGSRNKIEAANLKRQGTKAGVSDVILLIPKGGYASLCMEFKTRVGRQSEHQKEFQEQAESCGSKYVVVRSVKDAIEEVRQYLR